MEYLAKLEALWRKSSSSLVVVAGRRRIGKCLEFWGRKAARTATREILDVLSVTGGASAGD